MALLPRAYGSPLRSLSPDAWFQFWAVRADDLRDGTPEQIRDFHVLEAPVELTQPSVQVMFKYIMVRVDHLRVEHGARILEGLVCTALISSSSTTHL